MTMYCITFRSVTLAQRGERTLMAAGHHCALARTPRWMEERGCGYCLRLRERDGEGAVAQLREHGIPYGKVYTLRDEGMQEVVL